MQRINWEVVAECLGPTQSLLLKSLAIIDFSHIDKYKKTSFEKGFMQWSKYNYLPLARLISSIIKN